jgi:Zn finger protein HypA/HybF involved in hydrogenase expression
VRGESRVPASRSGRERALIRELALAQAIVDVATRQARGRTVAAIELRVGREREVAPDGVGFAFSLLSEGTPLDGAALEIEQVAGCELALHALRLEPCGAPSRWASP